MKSKFLSLMILALTLSSCGGSGTSRNIPPPVINFPDEEEESTKTTEVQFALVALSDAGKSGKEIGCGDSLVTISKNVEGDLTDAQKIQAALEALFAIKSEYYGQSGLYNGLGDKTDLKVDSISDEASITVNVSGTMSSGGVCDDPRIEEQIFETVRANSEKDDIKVYINGKDLNDYFNMSGE